MFGRRQLFIRAQLGTVHAVPSCQCGAGTGFFGLHCTHFPAHVCLQCALAWISALR